MKIKIIISLLFLIFLLVLGLFWLAFGVVLIAVVYLGVIKAISLLESSGFKKILKGVFSFMCVVCIVVVFKLLAFDIFKIPSSSMENTLFTNDVIVVDKLQYGPRLPRSPFDIPLVNIACYFNEKARKRIKKYWWPSRRLSGTSSIKQGDVLVFNSSWRKDFILVKRCVAIAGDTLKIEDAAVYTNGNYFNQPKNVKHNYVFKVPEITALYRYLDTLELNNISIEKHRSDSYSAILSKTELHALKNRALINNEKRTLDTLKNDKLFFKSLNNWTFTTMGPIVVPKKGMQIELNAMNFALYNSAIRKSEKRKIVKRNGLYYIKNKEIKSYVFKQDYYFMMGDNRAQTMDSRVWGFVPKANVIGKVQAVLYSYYGHQFNWDRLFKSVN